MNDAPLLQARGLSKSFGGVKAVQGVDLSVQAGRMLALMGPNGAGKSTTFNVLNGQLQPDAGEVWIQGQRVLSHEPRALWQLGVGRTFQIAQTFSQMTALQQVQLALQAKARPHARQWWQGLLSQLATQHRTEAMHWLDQLGLADQADQCPANMPYGWVKRLELALCLCQSPRIVLMDEPTAGLSAQERLGLMQLTRRLTTERAIAVIFTEHSLDAVFGFADDMVLLSQGQVVAHGHPDEVRRMAHAQALYFGSAA
ncbi:MAG: ABC transporter ATP-binding protein [Betaproteobacteria bacterium]|jgi:branched-chain amino acid transport system ATP-binding protein|nr:ABC transporter ATP-binding protein [Betaproteobacteria bacterium]NBP44790.1 ABC transporter ATP-binding protein [Betaproteobacteria bacterium]